MEFLAYLILPVILGAITSSIASNKGHDATNGFLGGCLFGFLGMIYYACQPDLKAKKETERMHAESMAMQAFQIQTVAGDTLSPEQKARLAGWQQAAAPKQLAEQALPTSAPPPDPLLTCPECKSKSPLGSAVCIVCGYGQLERPNG